ncbi:tyrosine-type recombinase/integrase [Rhizobium rhizoryzae]|uniref:Integrase n=1 Tax=Rhizobium rhizoryzae TaxID=451876 RepID=A0A7W6LKG6_9HYPH|nr:site-specific integrase [Rhizobium rhizoryzae]MBB4145999.1 integrase [Rhizobium rhizoryzae]
MASHMNKGLPYHAWPQEDRDMFKDLAGAGGLFDDTPWGDLSKTTVRNRRYAYGNWLGFLDSVDSNYLKHPPSQRVTPELVKCYVEKMRLNCTETAIAIALQRLYLTVKTADPKRSWDWLFLVQRRIQRAAIPVRRERLLSPDLYRIGVELMNDAKRKRALFDRVIISQAEQYRDGLMIAMLAETVIRRAGFTALRIDDHVVRIGERWRIFVTEDMVKTGEEQDFELSEELGAFLDDYLTTYRPVFPGADQHKGMWPYGDRPMTDKMVRRYIRKHTGHRLGIPVSPHDFRRAAATFVAEVDPRNVRMIKDLLGHRTFAMTEKHYIDPASSRAAGRELASIVEELRKDENLIPPLT